MDWLMIQCLVFLFLAGVCYVPGWVVIGLLAGQDCVDESAWGKPAQKVWAGVSLLVAFGMMLITWTSG